MNLGLFKQMEFSCKKSNSLIRKIYKISTKTIKISTKTIKLYAHV
jgi:hypothetical protein